MILEIVKDTFFLSLKSSEVKKEDLYIAQDLKDTLSFHKDKCVGMAANMIGYNKRMIIFMDQNKMQIMINPEIIKKSTQFYKTEEGCLSLEGVRPCTRYEKIKVKYLDENWKVKIKSYEGFVAQIIQHEMDHLEGIII